LLGQGMFIIKIPLGSSKQKASPLVVRSAQTATGVDADCANGRVFWTDTAGRVLRSSSYTNDATGSSKQRVRIDVLFKTGKNHEICEADQT